jgi:hypothetical protein
VTDRSRNKGWGIGSERSEGGKVDDRDRGMDSDRGVDGKLLREWDGGIGSGSSRVFICKFIVAIRGHIRCSVVIKELRSSESGRMRRLSDDRAPYMCFCFGV